MGLWETSQYFTGKLYSHLMGNLTASGWEANRPWLPSALMKGGTYRPGASAPDDLGYDPAARLAAGQWPLN